MDRGQTAHPDHCHPIYPTSPSSPRSAPGTPRRHIKQLLTANHGPSRHLVALGSDWSPTSAETEADGWGPGEGKWGP